MIERLLGGVGYIKREAYEDKCDKIERLEKALDDAQKRLYNVRGELFKTRAERDRWCDRWRDEKKRKKVIRNVHEKNHG